jgi:nitroimidazol reductase NimA-like FMN-containing flavoprotein (pyridoxamine 5'-phosphate oxidase superfamily)
MTGATTPAMPTRIDTPPLSSVSTLSASAEHIAVSGQPLDAVRSALAEGRQAYIAFENNGGPHVSPTLYSWSDDRLWFAAAPSTMKARVLQRDRKAAVVVPLSGRDVVLSGALEAFDARRPLDLASRVTRVPNALRAAARFTIRNAHDLVGFAGDAVSGKIGARIPPPRVFFALTPDRIALVQNDRVAGAWGWNVDALERHTTVPPGGEPAVAAFCGPVAVSCRWYEDEQRLFVSPELLGLSGIGQRIPVAVVVDRYNAPGPAAKRGTLRRGTGVRAAEAGFIDVTIDRTVDWDGIHVTSNRATPVRE